MRDGRIQAVTLDGGGTLVLSGATLPFAVLVPQYQPVVGGVIPHG